MAKPTTKEVNRFAHYGGRCLNCRRWITADTASITTTVRKKRTLSTSSWRPAHAIDSFVALPSVKRFPAMN